MYIGPLFLLLFVGSSSSRVDILNTLRGNPFADANSILAAIPGYPSELVHEVVEEVQSMVRVPNWFHQMLVNYVDSGGEKTSNPELVRNIIKRGREINGFNQAVDSDTIGETVKNWLIFCVFPRKHFEGMCHESSNGSWVLSKFSAVSLIEFTITREVEEENRRKRQRSSTTTTTTTRTPSPSSVDKRTIHRIEGIFRNSFSKQPEQVARELNCPLELVQRIKADMIRPFVQPRWFFETLMAFEGPGELKADNPALLEVIRRKFQENQHLIVQGDLEVALHAWIGLVVRPLKNHAIVGSSLPYRTIGQNGDYCAIDWSLVKLYVVNRSNRLL
jgi:hypothetical protein